MSSDSTDVMIRKNNLNPPVILVDAYSPNRRRNKKSNKRNQRQQIETINVGRWLLIIFTVLIISFFAVG